MSGWSKHTFELLDAIIIGVFFTFAKEIKDLLSVHAKASLQNVLQVLIECFNLLDVAILEFNSKWIVKSIDSRMDHFFYLIFMSFGGSLRHLSQKLVFTALSKSIELVLKVCRVQGHFLFPAWALDYKLLGLACIALHVLRDKSVQNFSQLICDLF